MDSKLRNSFQVKYNVEYLTVASWDNTIFTEEIMWILKKISSYLTGISRNSMEKETKIKKYLMKICAKTVYKTFNTHEIQTRE